MVENPTASNTAGATALGEAIEREYAALRRGVELLAWRAGLAHGRDAIAALAEEVLHEALARALGRAADFDPARSAHAWLLGFAVNVLRERRRAAGRAPALVSLDAPAGGADDGLSLAERLYDPHAHDDLRLAELLEMVGPRDALGIGEGAARVRQSRAVHRLAEAYRKAERGPAAEGDA
jgi:DNA-directed RNA polymerase specialized sigma24 family protein